MTGKEKGSKRGIRLLLWTGRKEVAKVLRRGKEKGSRCCIKYFYKCPEMVLRGYEKTNIIKTMVEIK